METAKKLHQHYIYSGLAMNSTMNSCYLVQIK